MTVTKPKNKKKYAVQFVVFTGNRVPILGFQTCQTMKLIKVQRKNFLVAAIAESIPEDFADVFEAKLGSLPGTQNLKIRADAKSKIMANRRIPISIRPKLKKLLETLVEQGVIKAVEEPTPWVSQIVLSHKRSGDIRMCLDPHEINKVLEREHYTLPILDDVLHEAHPQYSPKQTYLLDIGT